MSRLAPGHSIQQGVDTATQAFGVSRRLGARRCRLWLADAAGKAGTFIASLEWESMAARGRGFDKFQDDP